MYNNTDDDGFEFLIASNPEPRCPLVLLLDNSSSMHGEKIKGLTKWIACFKECILDNQLAGSGWRYLLLHLEISQR
jgi:hypothetical protein